MDETGMTPRITVPDGDDAAIIASALIHTVRTAEILPSEDAIRMIQLAALLLDKDN